MGHLASGAALGTAPLSSGVADRDHRDGLDLLGDAERFLEACFIGQVERRERRAQAARARGQQQVLDGGNDRAKEAGEGWNP